MAPTARSAPLKYKYVLSDPQAPNANRNAYPLSAGVPVLLCDGATQPAAAADASDQRRAGVRLPATVSPAAVSAAVAASEEMRRLAANAAPPPGRAVRASVPVSMPTIEVV